MGGAQRRPQERIINNRNPERGVMGAERGKTTIRRLNFKRGWHSSYSLFFWFFFTILLSALHVRDVCFTGMRDCTPLSPFFSCTFTPRRPTITFTFWRASLAGFVIFFIFFFDVAYEYERMNKLPL